MGQSARLPGDGLCATAGLLADDDPVGLADEYGFQVDLGGFDIQIGKQVFKPAQGQYFVMIVSMSKRKALPMLGSSAASGG
ncbi:MAG: hypothetical protein EA370_07990 [Wenzhouxiangella sp.]|nr:MAG: hypothetical protein EA370_07990 [Wenzhouxiangella sp.]